MLETRLIRHDYSLAIYSKDNLVYKVSEGFLNLIGYKYVEIIGKTLRELSVLLKVNCQIDLEDIKEEESLYIFTNEDFPLDVTISFKRQKEEDINIYYIQVNPNPTLRWTLENFNSIHINEQEAVAIYSYPDLIHLKGNKKYSDDLISMGVNEHNFIGKKLSYPEALLKIVKEKSSSHLREVETIDENGIVNYWDISGRLIHGNNERDYFLFSFYDVTERVLEKREHEKERIEMKIILDSISDAINKVDKNGNFTYLNKVAKQKMSSYTDDFKSLDDKKQYGFFKYNDINGTELSFEDTPIQRVLKGETLDKYTIIGTSHLPTTYHQCNGVPIYDDKGNIEGGVLVYKDIESIFQIEEYQALKENIDDIYLNYASISYDDFKIRYINDSAFKIVKRNRPETVSRLYVIGKNFFDFYNTGNIKKEEFIGDIRKVIKDKRVYTHKKSIREDGKTKYIKTVFKPIIKQNGEIEKIAVINMDITDEEISNIEMKKSLKTQEDIFINTSHELKTPLNLIFSASQLLNKYLGKDSIEDSKADIKYSNDIILQNCYRLTKLINNILDNSKIESGFYKLNLTNNNIVEVIGYIVRSVSEYTKDMGLEIVFNHEVEEIIMAFDVNKFERILLNLISNAIKFSSKDGKILINLVVKNKTLEISVKDNGIGIKEKDLDTIFKKFVQVTNSLSRSSEGTGIGLSLVKSLVELHEGTISVESIFGKGSTFKINLPITTVKEEQKNQEDHYYKNKLEMIKFELSDIYS